MAFICEFCSKSYKSSRALVQHLRVSHENIKYACDVCKFSFSRITNLVKHQTGASGAMQCRLNVIAAKAKIARGLVCAPTTMATFVTPTTTTTTIGRTTTTATTTTIGRTTTPTTTTIGRTTTTTTTSTTAPPSSSSSSSTIPMAEPESEQYRYCEVCRGEVKSCYWPYHLRTNSHKRNSGIAQEDGTVVILKSAFRERIQTLLFENTDEGELRAEAFLKRISGSLLQQINDLVAKHTAIKWNIELFGEYIKMVGQEISSIDIKSHQTKMQPSLQSADVNGVYREMINTILTKMSEFQERDSGWTLVKLLHLEVNVNQYRPITGSSYIPLPVEVLRRKACVNVQNSDEYCFKWTVISSLFHEIASPQRCSSYGVDKIKSDVMEIKGLVVDFTGLEFPLPIKDIALFEKQNPLISVNVFGYDNEIHKVVGPYYITKEEKVHHINMMMLQQEEKSHFVWIKNLSR